MEFELSSPISGFKMLTITPTHLPRGFTANIIITCHSPKREKVQIENCPLITQN